MTWQADLAAQEIANIDAAIKAAAAAKEPDIFRNVIKFFHGTVNPKIVRDRMDKLVGVNRM